jgi:hypothetical protein
MLAPFGEGAARLRRVPHGQQLTMRIHLAPQGGKQSSQPRPRLTSAFVGSCPGSARMLCCRVSRLRYLQEAADASSGAIGGKMSLKEISTAVTLHAPLLFF